MFSKLEPLNKIMVQTTATVQTIPLKKICLVQEFSFSGLHISISDDHQVPNELVMLRGQAIDLSSHLEAQLKSYLQGYFCTHKDKIFIINKDLSVGLECDIIKKKINQLDFMTKRNLLSKVLKKDDRMSLCRILCMNHRDSIGLKLDYFIRFSK